MTTHRAQTGLEVPEIQRHWLYPAIGGTGPIDTIGCEYVKYADHLAALAAARADNEALQSKASDHQEYVMILADVLGLPIGKDSADEVLDAVEAMRKLLGTCREALIKLRDYASGYNVASTIQIALDAFPQQANDGGKGA